MEKVKAQFERIRVLNEILEEDMKTHLEELEKHKKFLSEKPQNWDDYPGYPHGKARVCRTMLMIRQETIKLENILNEVVA